MISLNDFPFYYDDKAMKDTEKKLYGKRCQATLMKTDIKETDRRLCRWIVDLPGFTKDEIQAGPERRSYLTSQR